MQKERTPEERAAMATLPYEVLMGPGPEMEARIKKIMAKKPKAALMKTKEIDVWVPGGGNFNGYKNCDLYFDETPFCLKARLSRLRNW